MHEILKISFNRSQTGEENDYPEIEKINNRFACPICKKTFTLKRNCRRHIQLHLKSTRLPCGFCELTFTCRDYLYAHIKRMHPGETMDSNNKHIQRLFGDRLYSKPSAWLKVECKLCSKTFTTTKELRLHLENHNDLQTLNTLNLDDQIIQHFFPNNSSLEMIKETILKDISEKDYFKYYLVLNEFSYEMSLSDTEVDDLEDEAQHAGNYNCELCSEEFSFKYQVFSHLKEVHPMEEIPLTCKRCKLEFVSIEMHEKHLQTHCHNKDKDLCCTSCPGRFVWPQNLINHNCPLNIYKNEEEMLNVVENKSNIITEISQVNDEDELNSNTLNINEDSTLVSNIKNEQQNNEIIPTYSIMEVEDPTLVSDFKIEQQNSEIIISHDEINKKVIRCALCEGSFQKLQHLHDHMPLHADGKTGIDFENSTYIKVFKQFESIDYRLWEQEIEDAYTKSQINQFYLAIDKDGNELDISDSDSTDDTDFSENIKIQYSCVVCKVIFHKRKLLLKHQQEQHYNMALPFKCKQCNQQYVNFKLLQQHLKKICSNAHRQNANQCEYCNESFIWPQNLLKHKEVKVKLHTSNIYIYLYLKIIIK